MKLKPMADNILLKSAEAQTSTASGIILATTTKEKPAIYEVVSAGGTVGLTAALTPTLHPFALIVLMCMMFFGRLGILTITLAIATRFSERSPSIIAYPDANILIG